MRAFAVTEFSRPIEAIEVTTPEPEGTEVVLEVRRCGVCHTDLHLQDGYYNLGGGKRAYLKDRGLLPPLVLGHEILGRLVAKGPDAPAETGEIGHDYIAFPWLGCGKCEECLSGNDTYCASQAALGIVRPGGYAERCLVPHPKYLVDVTSIDPSLAATYACSGLTAYSALKKTHIDREKDILLILGVGGVGMNAVQIALGLGYKRIAAADLNAEKRAYAKQCGAAYAFDPSDADAVREFLAGEGNAGAVIDFVGAEDTATLGISALKKGGTYVIVGLFGGELKLPLLSLVQRAIEIKGSYVGSLAELKELVELGKSGKIPPLPVETLDASQINDAFDRLRGGKINGRIVLARQ
ncbi:alcohol dehydrogenase [Brucella intermedia]|uniref:alcohol dehydrogenase n=1 Tax=Brucella intermedia TaxID=94625 RepID=UPI00224A8930|nr:alcohol dehydrogenase [Brucella intermedia]